MKKIFFLLLISFHIFGQTTETPQWRPAYHFSPQKNWINDPNGLIFHEGEWHLFFQHNPYENKWGHMSWGHAVSKDLINWQELPVAIPEDSVWIFSGTVVIDKANSAGFGKNAMIAIYTADYHGKKENQHLAFSTDKGRIWTKYKQNPLIPKPLTATKEAKDFRDPYVFWHEPSQQWVMTVMLPTEFKVQFYGSKNLKNWTFLSEFSNQGDVRKIWECPSFIEVPIQNQPNKTAWVLMLSSNGANEGFTGMQYFVGSFDGKTFKNYSTPETKLYLDYGKDFYAAIPFNNTERKIILGWQMSWQYAEKIPTFPWKGQMSLPREISLKQTSEGLRLHQQPIKEIIESKNWRNVATMNELKIEETETMTWLTSNTSYRIDVEFEVGNSNDFGIKLLQNPALNQETTIGYRADTEQMYVDRSQSGIAVSDNFLSMESAPLKPQQGKVRYQIFVDKSVVEIFANNGEQTISSLVFPTNDSLKWQFFSHNAPTKVISMNIYEWK